MQRWLGLAGRVHVVAAVAIAAVVLAGCANRRIVKNDATGSSRFSTVLSRGLSRDEPVSDGAHLVLFSQSQAVGVDPATGEKTWERPIRAFGQPATYGDLVVLPIAGNKLLALNATAGTVAWQAAIPGQAVTGVTIAERWVLVASLATSEERARLGARSVLTAFGAGSGRRRWVRYSSKLLGVPAAAGRFGFVPNGDDVLALSLISGRVMSRLSPRRDVPVVRVERSGGTLLAGSQSAFVDLADGGSTRYRVQAGPEQVVFDGVQGMDPGMGHDDGITFDLLPAVGAGAPRSAIFVGRRAIFFLRLDAIGRPVVARWVHIRYDQHEYVAVHPTRSVILAVRDDGAVVHIDRRTGRKLKRFEGHLEPLGAAFVGRAPAVDDTEGAVDHETMVANLVGLIEDPDPRLVPAQRLAVDLLWRDTSPKVRRYVNDLARGILRPEGGEPARLLAQHAAKRTKEVWGRATDASLATTLQSLNEKRESGPTLVDISRDAVASGGPAVIASFVALLDNPALQADELVAVARALRDLEDPTALGGVGDFIVRYHADPDIVSESEAVFVALELVIALAQPDLPQRIDEDVTAQAQLMLSELLADEFTVPEVRAFIDANTGSGGPSDADGGDPVTELEGDENDGRLVPEASAEPPAEAGPS